MVSIAEKKQKPKTLAQRWAEDKNPVRTHPAPPGAKKIPIKKSK